MELILGLTMVIAVCVALAIAIRFVLVVIAKRNGHAKNNMPMHYHMFGIGIYFSIFWLLLFILHRFAA
jgi:hypothetical protein